MVSVYFYIIVNTNHYKSLIFPLVIEFCYISQCELKLSGSSNPYVSAFEVSGIIGAYHTAGMVKYPCLCLGLQSIHLDTVLSFTVWLLKHIVSH